MKKFFFILTILVFSTLVLVGCGDEGLSGDDKKTNGSKSNNSDVMGSWTYAFTYTTYSTVYQSEVSLAINDGTWILVFAGYSPDTYNGTWTRTGDTLSLKSTGGYGTATASLSGKNLILTQPFSTSYGRPATCTLTKVGGNSGDPNDPDETGDATLIIKNDSGFEITDVIWNNTPFTESGTSIAPGTSVTKTVSSESGFIFFKIKTNSSLNARTQSITVAKNGTETFTFYNNMPTVDASNASNASNTGTLGSMSGVPMITVKQGDTIINQHGELSFGTILPNTTKELTFTIENSGGLSLTLAATSNERVLLEDNNTGYYSMNLFPISATVTPGTSTTFTIRYNPTVVGSNYAATVLINTDSQNYGEFAFRIIGGCSNAYQIGDTGPGGGIVFFAEGGQYKECSGELGTYNWTNAMTTTQNYSGGGFTNWHLPDSGELDLMYQNLHKKGMGGFFNDYYWTSEKYSSSYPLCQNFNNGVHAYGSSYPESSPLRVRAVRDFTLQ